MSEFPGARRWMAIAIVICALLVLPVCWDASQGWVFPDGTSYLDMASAAIHDSPLVLLKNAYWSPVYPAILALMMVVLRPGIAAELRAVYTLNWLAFLVAAACFSLLLAAFVNWLRRNLWPELVPGGILWKALLCFAYAFFLLANMNQTLWYITPDMFVQALVYLSAACALRIFLPAASWKHSLALGLALGLGYLAKAAMFPAALLLIGILFLKPPKDRLGRRHSLIALACFCLLAAPLILSLSREKHRLTFGDSGKLNYAWFIGNIPTYSGWTGNPAADGTLQHPPRRISEAPLILEFRTPVGGTEPLWYDPSYWWDGLSVSLSVQRQLAGFFRPFTQVHSMQTMFLSSVALLLAALAPFCLLSFRVRKVIRGGGIQTWLLILWPAATCLMYSLVLFNFRYIAPYLVLIALGIAALLLQPLRSAAKTRALLAAALLLLLVCAVRLRPVVFAALRPADSGALTLGEGRDNGTSSAAVARELFRLGIRPGDEISVLGHSLDCYYARLASVRIVAHIWEDPERIAGLSAPEVRRVLTRLKQFGIKALIARAKPGFVNDEGWVAVPRTDVYVRML